MASCKIFKDECINLNKAQPAPVDIRGCEETPLNTCCGPSLAPCASNLLWQRLPSRVQGEHLHVCPRFGHLEQVS